MLLLPPPPDPDPGEGEEDDPNWGGQCTSMGSDGGGTKIGTIDARTSCEDGLTYVYYTCNPRLTGSQTVTFVSSICDKIDGGTPAKGTTTLNANNQDSRHAGYNMDHCNNWWPYMEIQTPGWYRGTFTSN